MKLILVFYMLNPPAVVAAVNPINRNFTPDSLNYHQKNKLEDATSDKNYSLDLLNQLRMKSEQRVRVEQRINREVIMCDRCHSSDLHSQNSFLPILQGQNLEYMFSKILYFKQNKRSFHPLQSLTQGLSIDDIMDISLYYSRQESDLKKSLVVRKFAEHGADNKNQFSSHSCSACHGDDGNGEQLIPDISGQNENYLSYRIREISRNDSKVHIHSVAPVNCEIPHVDIAGSKRLARLLALVLDNERVARGAQIYHQDCARCHDQGEQGAPKLSDKKSWSKRILQGTRELVRNTVIGKSSMPLWGGNSRLSRNQLMDAIHFMIYQASQP